MVTAKKAMTNRTKSEFTSHYGNVAKTNFFLLLFQARFSHARCSSRMIERFRNWGDHGKPKGASSEAVASLPGYNFPKDMPSAEELARAQ